MLELAAGFRRSVLARERLLGLFLKTPSHHLVELLALAGLDFLILDAEHAPFPLDTVDRCVVSGKAFNLPVLVRIAAGESAYGSACLDLGAAGLVVAHVSDPEAAGRAAGIARFAHGRGLSPSPRAGNYGGWSFPDFAARSDESITLWAQVEDAAGVAHAAEIIGHPAIDCLFVGRVDLAHSLGEKNVFERQVAEAARRCVSTAHEAGCPAALMTAPGEDLSAWEDLGASIFIVGTDQGLLRNSAAELVRSLREAASPAR